MVGLDEIMWVFRRVICLFDPGVLLRSVFIELS